MGTKSDLDEDVEQVGGIASRVWHSRPYYKKGERPVFPRTGREHTREKALRHIQERHREDWKYFNDAMAKQVKFR